MNEMSSDEEEFFEASEDLQASDADYNDSWQHDDTRTSGDAKKAFSHQTDAADQEASAKSLHDRDLASISQGVTPNHEEQKQEVSVWQEEPGTVRERRERFFQQMKLGQQRRDRLRASKHSQEAFGDVSSPPIIIKDSTFVLSSELCNSGFEQEWPHRSDSNSTTASEKVEEDEDKVEKQEISRGLRQGKALESQRLFASGAVSRIKPRPGIPSVGKQWPKPSSDGIQSPFGTDAREHQSPSGQVNSLREKKMKAALTSLDDLSSDEQRSGLPEIFSVSEDVATSVVCSPTDDSTAGMAENISQASLAGCGPLLASMAASGCHGPSMSPPLLKSARENLEAAAEVGTSDAKSFCKQQDRSAASAVEPSLEIRLNAQANAASPQGRLSGSLLLSALGSGHQHSQGAAEIHRDDAIAKRDSNSIESKRVPGAFVPQLSAKSVATSETENARPWPRRKFGHQRTKSEPVSPSLSPSSTHYQVTPSNRLTSIGKDAKWPVSGEMKLPSGMQRTWERGEGSEDSVGKNKNKLRDPSGDSEASGDDFVSPIAEAAAMAANTVTRSAPGKWTAGSGRSVQGGAKWPPPSKESGQQLRLSPDTSKAESGELHIDLEEAADEGCADRAGTHSNELPLDTRKNGGEDEVDIKEFEEEMKGPKMGDGTTQGGTWGRGFWAGQVALPDNELQTLVRKIKDLDTGREFIVDESLTDDRGQSEIDDEADFTEGVGRSSLKTARVRELGTDREYSYKEFESSLGISPLTKELERRQKQRGEERESAGEEESDDEVLKPDGRELLMQAAKGVSGRRRKRDWLKALGRASLVALKVRADNTGAGETKASRGRDEGGKSFESRATSESDCEEKARGSEEKTTELNKLDISAQSHHLAYKQADGKDGMKQGMNRPNRVKVNAHKKPTREFTDLRIGQEIQAHQGTIWVLKFSCDGRFLASAGADKVVKVWEVVNPPPVPSLSPSHSRGSSWGKGSHSRASSGSDSQGGSPHEWFQRRGEAPGGQLDEGESAILKSERKGVGRGNFKSQKHGKAEKIVMDSEKKELDNANAADDGVPQSLQIGESASEAAPQTAWANEGLTSNEDVDGGTEIVCDSTKRTDKETEWEATFWLGNRPLRCFIGHEADVLDLSWSKSKSFQFLLSASMDKTVRLWHVQLDECLRVFRHSDFVTCIDFSPIDDRLFVSGALDEKVRLWSVAEHAVQDWTDPREMVTTISFTCNGQGVVVGSHKGTCRFYDIIDNKLRLEDTLEVKSSRGKNTVGKRVTGLQSMPGEPMKVLITSHDSRIRIYDGMHLHCKYKGHKNTNIQMSASFDATGKYILCASEDSNVYIWNTVIPDVPSFYGSFRKEKPQSYEFFESQNATGAIFWPGYSCRPGAKRGTGAGTPERRVSDPLEMDRVGQAEGCVGSEAADVVVVAPERQREEGITQKSGMGPSQAGSRTVAGDRLTAEERAGNIKRGCEPRGLDEADSAHGGSSAEKTPLQETAQINRKEERQIMRKGGATGMVIVTAGHEGMIRTYQNFGPPSSVKGGG